MRRIATVSLIASWLALACGQQDQNAAGTPADKADEAKTEVPAETKSETPAPGEPGSPTIGTAQTPTTPVTPATPVAPEPKPAPAADEYGSEFCATIIPCYQKLEFAGSFMADVTVDIEPDGSVSAVSFTGEAPKPVKSCITDAIKNIELTTYNGKPGRTRCTKSGQLSRSSQMVMSDRTYEVRDPAASKLEANAASNGKTKGKAKSKVSIDPKGQNG